MFRASIFLSGVALAMLPFSSQAEGFADCPQFFPGKPPTVTKPGKLREVCLNEFAVLHSGETKTPVFVAQRLNAATLEQGQNLKRSNRFYPEARLPRAERAELSDYKGSGYSRGHMAPAGDMGTPEGKAQSFSLANIVPQDAKHNGGPWSKIEQDTRAYVRRAKGDVFVITGPIYEGTEESIGENKVRVPSHIFKLVFDPNTGKSLVHWQANAPETRVTPPITYTEFVSKTGLRLLP